jgi:hypothetical protein
VEAVFGGDTTPLHSGLAAQVRGLKLEKAAQGKPLLISHNSINSVSTWTI